MSGGQGLGLVVGHEHGGGAASGERMQHRVARVGPERGVEARERLVEQHQRRARRERAGDRDPALLAARQLPAAASGVMRG